MNSGQLYHIFCYKRGTRENGKRGVDELDVLPAPLPSSAFRLLVHFPQIVIANGDRGGIIFRADSLKPNFYYFYVSATGAWEFGVFHNGFSNILSEGNSSIVNTGLNQVNLVAVVANSSTFDLYINNQHIARISDSTYSHGAIAVFATDYNNSTDTIFSNVKIWRP